MMHTLSSQCVFSELNNIISFQLNFYFDLITDSHALVRNDAEGSCVLFTLFPSMTAYCINTARKLALMQSTRFFCLFVFLIFHVLYVLIFVCVYFYVILSHMRVVYPSPKSRNRSFIIGNISYIVFNKHTTTIPLPPQSFRISGNQ